MKIATALKVSFEASFIKEYHENYLGYSKKVGVQLGKLFNSLVRENEGQTKLIYSFTRRKMTALTLL